MANINGKMTDLGKVRSVIREIFEYGNKRAKEIGRENVFDFSLGNPSVPTPKSVDDSIVRFIETTNSVSLHGYTSAPGAENVRKAIADDLNQRFQADIDANDIYMTCGAAASLTITLHALVQPGDEVIVVAPFFPEYRVFVEKAGAKLCVLPADTKNFQINFSLLEPMISPNTKAILINTPNNPTGTLLSEETVTKLCELLKQKSQEYGEPIYLISDEPYRELVYEENAYLPYFTNCYDNTIVCYSFSKSLSLPGERIGYIVAGKKLTYHSDVYAAICGAGRALGFVCAPSLMQRVVAENLGKTADLAIYKKNRDLLYRALCDYGFSCAYPDGAFYLFMKSPEENAAAFCERAKKYELLLVPSDSFGCKGYVRISYCVTTEMIQRALPSFKKLAEEYEL